MILCAGNYFNFSFGLRDIIICCEKASLKNLYNVKHLYIDIRYNFKIRYNDNLNGTIP